MQSFTVNAPVRADLSGGTLDIWPLYCLVGGARTVNIGLNLIASAHFEEAANDNFQFEFQIPNEDPFTIEGLLSESECSTVDDRIRFPVFLVNEYLKGKALPKKIIKMRVETKAPRGSGLGGSSTLAVAVTVGMARIFGDYIDQGWQWKMCEWVRDVEATYLKTPTGTQDYLGALFGGLAAYDAATSSRKRYDFDSAVFEGLKSRILVLYSGEMHDSGLSNWDIFKRAFEGDDNVLAGLRQLREISDKTFQLLEQPKTDWKDLGQLMNKEWDTRRDMFHVNTPRLDEIVSYLRSQPILGCKVCGAAAGGSLVAIVEPKQMPDVVAACKSQQIECLSTEPVESGVSIVPSKLAP